MAMGAVLGLALVGGLALILPSGKTPGRRLSLLAAGCQRYFLVPVEWTCGSKVIYVNPDGSKVNIGKTKDMAPMPRARPVQTHP